MRAALCGLVATVLLALAASGEAGVPEGEAALRAGDQARALREFRPAAEAGEAPAQVYLGTMYLHGVGVKRDVAEAARWFLRAAEQGDAEGQAMIGAMYFDGAGVRQDGDEALRWFRRAAEQGFAGGEWGVGAAYENGGGVERNLETALLWYRKAAARGHAAAQSRLGYFYESGQGVEANVREAAEWYRKSAEGGYSDGQAAWGWVLEHGRGVSADAKTAAAWYQKAAERGHPAALRQLGLLYEAGRGVPRNLEAAAGLFQKAAERGDAVGRFQLGRMLARGQGVAADPALAAKLFRKAADEGHVPAYLSLADVLLVGRGVDADPPQALEWLTKASDAGSRDAKFRLGLLYEAGIFAAQGNVGAAQWYRDALGSRADGAERSVFDDRIEMGLERAKTAAEWTALRARWLARGGAPLAGRRGRTFGRGEAGARIVLEALPDVANATPQAMSVEIRDAEGSRVFAANLEAGDRYLVPARSDLLLYPGRYHPNAPILQLPADDLLKYLRITVDGTPVKLEAGERLGAVRLDPDRLQSGEGVLIQRPEALLPVRRSGRILIRGIADSVIDVHDEDYVVGFIERRLAPGEQFEPPSRPDLWLLVHPRSQVEVVVDGERRLVLVPPPFREIRLRLDPDRLRSARVLPVADRRRMSGNGKDDRPAPLSLVVGADGVVGELHLQTPRGRVSMEDAVAASRLQQRGADVGEYLLQQYREQLRWHGPSSPETAEALYALAQSDLRRRDLSTALTRFHAFQRTLEELGLADDEEYAAALIGLAQAYVAIGQYQNAERLAYRVLVFADERADGRSDARLALDASYPVAGPRRTRSDEASGTGRRRADAAWLANTQRTMYRLLADLVQHRHDDVVAELFLSRTMLLDELGDPDFNLAVGPTPLLEMHAIAQRRGEDTLAQAVLHRAHWSAKVDLLLRDAPEPLTHPLDLSHTEVIGGPTAHSQVVAGGLARLAEVYRRQRRFDEAAPLVERALEISRNAFGSEHVEVAAKLKDLAALDLGRGRIADALRRIREAAVLFARRGPPPSDAVDLHLAILDRARESAVEPARALIDESFQVAQQAHASDTAGAVARMAARVAAGAGPLSALVRERQDLSERRREREQDLIEAITSQPNRRDLRRESLLRDEVKTIGHRLNDVDAAIARDFPQYAELVNPRPLSIAALQPLLGATDILLAYSVRDDRTYLWAVRRDRAEFWRFDIGQRVLAGRVQALRASLDPSSGSQTPAFPVDAAHELYRAILEPAGAILESARHVFIVPDGPLQSLPLGVLIDKPPPRAIGEAVDYRAMAWLARRLAMTTLPAVSSIGVLRAAGASRAPAAFVGFGAPTFGDGSRRVAAARGYDGNPVLRGALADVRALQELEPLPEAADELRSIAQSLGADQGSVFLGDMATETRVKTMELSAYRIIAFATHGLIAGEAGSYEPALVLTPPKVPSELDDGLLSASEIAHLKLDADWVILSACNTAAPDGSPGAEGLSGLAKSFFYAGSRALLVSHWSVVSTAAVALTSSTFAALKAEPNLGRAEVLRRSMVTLIDSSTRPEFAHPMYWAPFVVVGDGGPPLTSETVR